MADTNNASSTAHSGPVISTGAGASAAQTQDPTIKKSKLRNFLTFRPKKGSKELASTASSASSLVVGSGNASSSASRRASTTQAPPTVDPKHLVSSTPKQLVTEQMSSVILAPPRTAEAVVTAPIAELWGEAWEELRRKDAALVADYEEYINDVVLVSAKSLAVMSTMTVTQPSSRSFSSLGAGQRGHTMKVLLEERITELDEERWKLKLGENQFAVKDLVEPVVGLINWSKDYIDSAVEASAYASVAWAGVSLMLPLVLNPGKQEAARAAGLEKVAALLRQCSIREALYRESYDNNLDSKRAHLVEHTNYRDELRILYVVILTFQATCLSHLKKHTISKAIRDMALWDDWDNLSQNIDKQNVRLKEVEEQWRDFKIEERWRADKERHGEQMAALDLIAAEMKRLKMVIEKAQKDRNRLEMLEWLSSEDCSKRYNNIRERHERSTGSWLVENSLYKEWRTKSRSFLWLHGKAGSGKSFLSSTAIDELQNDCDRTPYQALGYYYFNFDEQTHQGTAEMLSAIIRQLCGARPDTPDWLLGLAATFRDKGGRPTLKNLEEALWKAVLGFDAVYLIIDALDECTVSSDKRATLLKSIVKLQGCCPPNVHILCTSRKEPDIEAKFSTMLRASTADEVDLHDFRNAVDEDINIYLEERFESSEFDEISEENKNLARRMLLERADGMFQYVALQLGEIKESLSEDIPNLLSNLPQGLDETYVRMLRNIDKKYQKQAYQILVWVALSKQPLNAELLAEAAVIDPCAERPFDPSRRLSRLKERSGVLRLLQGLVIETESRYSSQIRFAHFSVQEFLFSTELLQMDTVSHYSIQNDNGNLLLAESCLCYHLYASQYREIEITKDNYLQLFPLWSHAAQDCLDYMEAVPRKIWTASIIERAKLVLAPKSEALLKLRQIWVPNNDIYDFQDWKITLSDLASPLYLISAYGKCQTLLLILENFDAEEAVKMINAFSKENSATPLQAAAYKGHTDMVGLLLDHKAEVNAQGGNFGNALQAAARKGSIEVVTMLLDHGADVNAQGGSYGNALHAAAWNGSIKVVTMLLDHGAEVNAQGGNFGNALQAAASSGRIEVVNLLLNRGAKINQPGEEWEKLLTEIGETWGEAQRLRDLQRDHGSLS